MQTLEPMKFALGDRVQTPLGAGKITWAADDERRQRQPHQTFDRQGTVTRTIAWVKLYHVELDPIPPAKVGSTFSFHESELSAAGPAVVPDGGQGGESAAIAASA